MKQNSRERFVVGVMSGTSADGVDAVLCRIAGRGERMKPEVTAHLYRAYPAALRRQVLQVAGGEGLTAADFCRLHWRLGAFYAECVESLLGEAEFEAADVTVVGLHGQTVAHLPPGNAGRRLRNTCGTLQIGEPTVIAERLRIPVLSRFREADLAAGGQGAPLVPWTDFVLFRSRSRARIVLNIGGIANATFIPRGAELGDVEAFDIGPGNMVIDGVVSHFSGGKKNYDRGGRLAAAGTVCEGLLKQWCRHSFFGRRPPKSCGREEFGGEFLQSAIQKWGKQLTAADFAATATELTACAVAGECTRWIDTQKTDSVKNRSKVDLIVCGGGAENRHLMSRLALHLPGIDIQTIDTFGIGVQQKEALSFAMLAAAHLDQCPANLPRVTGANRRVVLGQLTPANYPSDR